MPGGANSLQVAGHDVPFEWSPETGASITLPPIRVGFGDSPERLVHWGRLMERLRAFDADSRMSQVDLAGAGYEQVSADMLPALGQGWEEVMAPVWVRSVAEVSLGSPFVSAVHCPEGAETFHWAFGHAGLPRASATLLLGSAPPARVLRRVARHLALDADEVQVATYLSDPETLARARHAWGAASAQRAFALTLTKREHHVPYTKIARISEATRVRPNGVRWGAPLRVFALDIATVAGEIVTPAVVVAGGATDPVARACAAIVEAGFPEVEALHANGQTRATGAGSRRIFAKCPALLAQEEARAWLGSLSEHCSPYASRNGSLRVANG